MGGVEDDTESNEIARLWRVLYCDVSCHTIGLLHKYFSNKRDSRTDESRNGRSAASDREEQHD